jgi:hypothetical protein
MEKKDYEVFTYHHDWNKILTFNQIGREASENLNLTLTKFRVDYSGILDFITRIFIDDKTTDLFLFDSTFSPRSSTDGFIYDRFLPRDILSKWRTFLSFIFYNFGKDTLTFSSSSGDDFNLELDPGYNQFDDFIFNGDAPIGNTPKILPLKISFSCLINAVEFSKSILKINYQGQDLYIFVTEAETTDRLDEQKIKGNLIYFP